MKIKVIKEYKDTQLKRIVKVDEELEVTEARAKQLILAKVGLELMEEEPKKAAKKKKAKKDKTDE